MIPISKKHLNEEITDPIDCLLLCVSFEDRCCSIIDYLSSEKVNMVGIFCFQQYKNDIDENIKRIKNAYPDKTEVFECQNNNPISVADALIDMFTTLRNNSQSKKLNIVLDISTFTRESLLVTMKYLQVYKDSFDKIHVFYSTANIKQEHKLTSGMIQIRSVIGYMGDIKPNKPLHIILLSGFETERAKEIINSLEPESIAIGYGRKHESISEEMQLTNEKLTDQLKAYYTENSVHIFNFSLVNSDSVKNTITEEINKKPDHNIVIIPLNNKISTLGTGLAALERPEVQICYSQMENYHIDNYSTARDECYLFELQL